MVLEPHRTHYLRALGVDIYVSRQPLPGAAISQAVAWAVETDIGESACEEPTVLSGSLDAGSATTRRDVPINTRSALIDLDLTTKGGTKDSEKQPQSFVAAALPKVEAPRFSLLISRCETGVVVIDEGPRANQRREDYLRLLNNVLLALYRRPVVVESDLFVWPMVKNPLVDHGEQAARESLSAYLQRQCTLVNGKMVVALGAGPSQWMNDDPTFSIVPAVSLWRCLSDSSAKQTLWQQLQPLRTLSH